MPRTKPAVAAVAPDETVEPAVPTDEAPPTPTATEVPVAGMIFSSPVDRMRAGAWVGPGYHQSVLDRRRSVYDGIWYRGDPIWCSGEDADGVQGAVGRGHNLWFQMDPGYNDDPSPGLLPHPPFMGDGINNPFADITADGGNGKYYTFFAKNSKDTQEYIDSIVSHDIWYMARNMNYAENMSLNDLRLFHTAEILTSYLMPDAICKIMNIFKLGSPDMQTAMFGPLSILPGSGHFPSLSEFLTKVQAYFDKIPLPWPMQEWIMFAWENNMAISSRGDKLYGLCVPIGSDNLKLTWRWITGEQGYKDPIQAIIDEDRINAYVEYYLPLRCGIDLEKAERPSFVRPGGFRDAFKPWMFPGVEPIITSPTIYYMRKNQLFGLDSKSTITSLNGPTAGYWHYFGVQPGTGSAENTSNPTFCRGSMLRALFENVRPTGTEGEPLSVMIGRRTFGLDPKVMLAGFGKFNMQLLLKAVIEHEDSIYNSNGRMDVPMITERWDWNEDGDLVPVAMPDGFYSQTEDALYNGGVLDLVLGREEDMLAVLTGNPTINTTGVSNRIVRYPNFFDTFPRADLMLNPNSLIGADYVPTRELDLAEWLEKWLALYRFNLNQRKTGKIVRPT